MHHTKDRRKWGSVLITNGFFWSHWKYGKHVERQLNPTENGIEVTVWIYERWYEIGTQYTWTGKSTKGVDKNKFVDLKNVSF